MYHVTLLVLSVAFIIIASTRLSLHPFLALLIAALGYGIFSGMPPELIVESINTGFGNTLSSIGIIIVLGTIIGTFLENSGGAYAIAEKVLSILGAKRVTDAMGIIGYCISIPVFADSGLIIMYPLNRALAFRSGKPLASTTISLGLGLVTTHCLIPPTPGPIAAAGILGADLGMVILLGIPVSILALIAGVVFSKVVASRFTLGPACTDESDEPVCAPVANPPSAFHSFLPIFVPIALIILKSIADLPTAPFGSGLFTTLVSFIGAPVIALSIGVAIAVTLPRTFDKASLSVNGWVGTALTGAAMIIIITGAGGAFGKTLQNAGIAEVISDSVAGLNAGIWLPFILASAVKTAQGSSTVAIILTSSLLAPLIEPLGLDSVSGRALVVLAIGSGSMCFSHANDSIFWVISQLTGMTVKTGYQLWSAGTMLIGLTSAVGVWIMSLFLL